MEIIPEKPKEKKVPQNIRLKPDLLEKVLEIATKLGVTKTHVIESLLIFGITEFEKEEKKKSKRGK
jgi:hypothetical protein